MSVRKKRNLTKCHTLNVFIGCQWNIAYGAGGLRLGSLAVGVRENEAHAVYNKKIAIMLRLS